MSVNASSERDLSSQDHLTGVLLRILEEGGPELLTPTDVLYLTQMMELAAATQIISIPTSTSTHTEAMVSIATNYLKLASHILDPKMATQWLDLTEDGVRLVLAVLNVL